MTQCCDLVFVDVTGCVNISNISVYAAITSLQRTSDVVGRQLRIAAGGFVIFTFVDSTLLLNVLVQCVRVLCPNVWSKDRSMQYFLTSVEVDIDVGYWDISQDVNIRSM